MSRDSHCFYFVFASSEFSREWTTFSSSENHLTQGVLSWIHFGIRIVLQLLVALQVITNHEHKMETLFQPGADVAPTISEGLFGFFADPTRFQLSPHLIEDGSLSIHTPDTLARLSSLPLLSIVILPHSVFSPIITRFPLSLALSLSFSLSFFLSLFVSRYHTRSAYLASLASGFSRLFDRQERRIDTVLYVEL